MPRVLRSLIVLLGLTWLGASAASAAVALHAEKPASGSEAVVENLFEQNTRLSGEGVSEIPAIAYDFASDFPVAARGIAPQIAKIEKQLAQHGRASVEKSLRSLEKRLAEHRQALETYRAQGGFTSSVEREIRAFEAEIQAIKDVLGRGP